LQASCENVLESVSNWKPYTPDGRANQILEALNIRENKNKHKIEGCVTGRFQRCLLRGVVLHCMDTTATATAIATAIATIRLVRLGR
jgi:hypothetical protein